MQLAGGPIERALVIVCFFLAAWAVSRLAGVLVGLRHRWPTRRHAEDAGAADLVFRGKQRETAISLVETTVRYVAFLAAVAAAIVQLAPGHRVGAIAGASFAGILIAFAAQRVLIDVIQGLFMFFERWFAVGDTIVIEPWDVEGVVERVSLRQTTLRGVNGELMHVHNSQILAVRVVPSGLREFEIEVYVRDEALGRRLLERVGDLVPHGPTHFVRGPQLRECEPLADELVRLTAVAAVAPGREWLVENLLPSLLKEDPAAVDQLVHGPVVMAVDETATRRFARIVSAREQARQPRLPLARLGARRS
jgi:hypothetical protein